jgi:hypothetical protein
MWFIVNSFQCTLRNRILLIAYSLTSKFDIWFSFFFMKIKFKQWWSRLPRISTKRPINSKQLWSTILPISTKRPITSKQWWSTIPLISAKRPITSKQWWSTIPPISTKRPITSKQWWSTIPPISKSWSSLFKLYFHKKKGKSNIKFRGQAICNK